jgi:hypothetical protein
VLKVPLVRVIVLVCVIALPRVHPPPTPLKITPMAPRLILLVVTVFPVDVATKFSADPDVVENATPVAALVQEPYTLSTEVDAVENVSVPPVAPTAVRSKQLGATAVKPIVTV